VIYYTQFISRDDVPSVGLTQPLGRNIWNALGLPEHRHTSVLMPPPDSGPRPLRAEWEVSVLCMVRTNPGK
jgi:hypothetical protein